MSDLLEGVQREAQAIRKGYTPQQSGLLSAVDQEAQAIRVAEERKRAFMYGIPMSDSDYEIISQGIAESSNPDEERWNWGAALMYSQRLGIDVSTAKQNLEGISSAWMANPMNYKGKSHFEAIVDSFRAGDIQMEAADIAKQWRDGGGTDVNIERRLDELYGEMEKLQDHWPRNIAVEILKAGAQTAPFMVQTIGSGAMAAGAATLAMGALGGTAATAGIAAPVGAAATAAALKAFAFSAGSFMASFSKMSALEYYEMRKQGISHDVANTWSTVSGGAQAMIETALGNVPGLIGKVGGEVVTSISGKIAKKLFLSGMWGAAARAIMSYGWEVVEEGVEEALQSIVSDISKNIAAGLEEKGIPQTEAADIAKNAVEQFKGGVLAAVGMGLPGAFIGYKQAARQSKALSELAQSMDKDDFIYEASKWEGVADVPEKERKAALSSIWDAQQKRKAQESEKAPGATAEADIEVEGDDVEETDVRRTKEGTIRTELGEQRTNADGSTTAIVKAGEPDAPGRYGHARYTVDGDTVRIESVLVKESVKDKAEVRRSLVLEIAAQNPGLNIEWDTKSEENQAVKDRIAKENPRGVDAGLQWYGANENTQENKERYALRADLLSTFSNTTKEQAEVMTVLHERYAAHLGIPLSQYRREYIGFGKGIPEAVKAAQKSGKRVLGATVFKDAKAIMYAFKGHDFSTAIHESAHSWIHGIEAINGEDWQTVRKAFNIKGEKATDSELETIAYTFEEWTRTGKAKTPELQNIFQKIAEWMVNIYRKISGQITISDEIAEALEGLFRDPASPLSESTRDKGKAESTDTLQNNRQDSQNTTVFQSAETAGATTAPEAEEAARLWAEMGTESPYFKKWADGRQVFEVYHGTDAEFDAFDTSDRSMDLSVRNPRGDNIGSFFASKERDAKRFGPKVGKYYVGLKNPMVFKTQEDFRAFMREHSGMTPDVRNAEGFIISEGHFENNMRKAIESAGHDGVVILNPQYSAKKDKPWVIAFDPTQIKSVNNRGTFDANDPRILYQEAPPPDSEAFRQWFGDSKVVDEQGKPLVVYHGTNVAFNSFNRSMGAYGEGVYFTDSIDSEVYGANHYALNKWGAPKGAQIYPVYLSIQNPVRIVAFTTEANTTRLEKLPENVDGLIVEQPDGSKYYIARNPNQAKSIFNQNPTSDDRLLFQVDDTEYSTDPKEALANDFISEGEFDKFINGHYYGNSEISSRTTPAREYNLKAGTWIVADYSLMDGHPMGQLRLMDVNDIKPTEDMVPTNTQGRGWDSERYAEWMKEGKTPPPITVLEMENGEYTVTDGHRRYYAAKATTGKVWAWVWPIMQNPRHPDLKTGLTYEAATGKPWVKPEPILFQSEDALRSEARTFDTWREFMEYVEATDSQEDKAVEALPQDEREKWYRDFWKSAQAEKQKPISPQEADERFTSRIETNEGLDDFLAEINNILTFTVEDAPQDPEEQAYFEKRLDLQKRIKAMHPTVLNNATRVGLGRPITDRARAAIETLMKSGATYYRRLYAEIMDDASLQNVDKEQEAQALPRIEDPEEAKDWEAASIVNRVKIAKAIKNAEIKKRLMSGEIVPEKEMQDVIVEQDAKIAELEATVKAKEAEIADDYKTFTSHEKTFVEQKARIKELSDDLAKTERTIARLVERGQAVSEALTSARQEAALQLKSAKAQLAAVRATERTKAREAKQAAIDEVKAKIKEAQQKRADAKKVIDLKKSIANQIMRPTTVAISYDKRLKIEALQSIIDPHFRRAQIKWRGEMYNIEELRNNTQFLQDAALEKKLIDRLTKKPLNEWTIEELEKLNDEIQRLRDQGIQEWAAVIQERKAAAIRSASAIASQAFKSGKYEEPAAAGSAERAQQIKRKNSLWRQVQMKTLNAARIANLLDGGKDGENTRLLVKESREAYAEKMNNLDRRAAPIMEALEKAGYKGDTVAERAKELWERKYTIDKVGPDQSSVTLTADDLMYIAIALKDEHSRAAILYGNFASEKERLMQDDMEMKSWGMTKEQILRDAIKKYLTAEDMAIVDAIQKDYTNEFGRLNALFIEEFNVAMKQVGFYVPLVRETTASMDTAHEKQQAEEVLNVGGISIRRNPDKGFTHERVNIKPKNQRAVKLGLVATWLTAVEREEHFHAYTPYIRNLNRVYKSNSAHSRQVRDAIVNTYGTEAFKYIENYMNEQANPKSFTDQGLNKLVRGLRGDLGSAYLGWKLSGVVKQLITSPIPYSAYVSPLAMVRSAFTYASNPKAFDDFIKERSAIMRHRVQNPIIQVIKEGLADPKTKQKFAQFKEIGIKGLEIADWVSVATGWRAAYDSAIAKGQTDQEASAYADDVTLKCQPSARPEDLAPLFKTGSEFTRAFTQFQSALNVIWNQVSYDIPTAFKNKQFGYAFRQISAYVVAGILLGLVTRGKEDDDDTKADDFLYWSLTQFTDSVPLIGSQVNSLWRQVSTGEKSTPYSSSLMPALDESMAAMRDISEGDWGNAAKNFGEGVGLFLGAPVSGVKEIVKTVEEGPGALVGRRRK